MKKPLLIICMSILAHGSMGQAAKQWLQHKVSISVQQKPVAEVLKSLEKDLQGMVFAYSPGTFDVTRKVSVKMDSVTLEKLLQEVFAEQELECTEMRGKIFLRKKKKANDTGGRASGPSRRKEVINRPLQAPAPLDSTFDKRDDRHSDTLVVNRTEKVTGKHESKAAQPGLSVPESNDRPQKMKSVNASLPIQAGAEESMAEKRLSSVDKTATGNARLIDPLPPSVLAARIIKYRQHSFESPELPPVPFDSTQIGEPLLYKLGILKAPGQKKTGNNRNEAKAEEEKKKLRLYGASTTALTAIGGEAAIKMGGRAVWLKKSSLGFGLAGYAVQRPRTLDSVLDGEYRLAGGYGGVHVEYNLNPNSFLHLSFPLLLAGGGMTYAEQDTANPLPNRVNVAAEAIFVVEPGVSLEMNVIKYLKVGLDLSYRYTSNTGLRYETGGQILENTGLNALSAGITVKLGLF